jgi:4-hydroxy-2-oxoheptanedioate aldolase
LKAAGGSRIIRPAANVSGRRRPELRDVEAALHPFLRSAIWVPVPIGRRRRAAGATLKERAMQVPVNRFKQAIRSGNVQIGFWCSLASNVSAEILAGSGFDWLLLDTEHAPNELPMVYSQLQAVMETDTHPIVRPPWNDMVVIKRLLDAGVQTLLIPTVQTEAEARDAVAATRYPPNGVRGFAATSRASRFGRIENYYGMCEEQICVLVQVETSLGLQNLEAIAAVEGVDGVFIGPGDLSASLGYLGNLGHPDFQRIVEDAMRRIRATGKAPGILTGDEAFARRCLSLGCLFAAVGSDSGVLARVSEQLARRFKEGPA